MTDELDQKLCEKYPKIFCDRNSEDRQTLMRYGFCCGDGWYDIIDSLCAQIQGHVDWKRKITPFSELTDEEFEHEHQVFAVQVKEKFGGLRFYVSNCDDYVRGAVAVAESLSFRVCESCGDRGIRRGGGWIRTLCDSCYSQKGKHG